MFQAIPRFHDGKFVLALQAYEDSLYYKHVIIINSLCMFQRLSSRRSAESSQDGVGMNDRGGFYRNIGERIRKKRNERGLSQEGLAKAIGLKRPSMSNIEKGRQNLLLHTFCDIAETLGSDANSLLHDIPKTKSEKLPDLRSLSKEVREFVEAGIKTAKGQT
jgi:transcriptional regulator with XRE-family HTH domain